MKKDIQWTARLWMLFVLMAILVVGCSDDNVAPTPPEEEPEVPEEVVKTARELLSEMKGVTNIKDEKDVDGNDITSFYFEQPVDHKSPSSMGAGGTEGYR